MSPIDVCRQRLSAQHLVKQELEKASDVVQLFGAVQAQDYAMAKWGIAQRTRSASDAAVEKEISDGAILRTHVLRPTWHFVAPADIRWMLALTAPRVKALLAHHDRQLGLDAAVLRRSRAVLTKALKDGKQLTRAELSRALTKGGVRADGTLRLAHLMIHAELDGLICSGSRRGKQFTYALLEERVPQARKVERAASLHELAIRYFSTRGPATEDDFAWWSGLTKADAKSAAYSAEASLESEVIGGRRYWFKPVATAAKIKSPLAHLLPNFDEFFIGLRDRGAIQTKLKSAGAENRLDFLRGHLLIVDGQIVGGWKRTFGHKAVTVSLGALVLVREAEHAAIEDQVARFARFLDLPVRLEITPATRS